MVVRKYIMNVDTVYEVYRSYGTQTFQIVEEIVKNILSKSWEASDKAALYMMLKTEIVNGLQNTNYPMDIKESIVAIILDNIYIDNFSVMVYDDSEEV